MRVSSGFVAVLICTSICGCPGNPIEAISVGSGADGASSSAGSSSATSLTSAGDELGTDDGVGTSMGPSSATTPSTDPTAEPSSDTGALDTSGAPTGGTDASAGTSEGGTTTTGDTPVVCEGDEDEIHDDASVAIQLPDMDCNTAVQQGAGVLDAATGIDWWWFYGTDSVGTCEPDSVRVSVTGGGPLPVCALVQPGCTTSCTVGAPDGSGRGCCGTDTVQLIPDCGTDDNTSITFSFGLGTESCLPYTWDYEF